MTQHFVNPDANIGGNGTTNALSGANCAHVSVSVAESFLPATLTEVREIVCETGGSADTTAAVLTGVTTSSTNYLRIYPSSGHRHAGIWSTAKFRMDTVDDYCVDVGVNYVYLEGLQLTNNTPGGDARHLVNMTTTLAAGLNLVTLQECIFRGHNHATFAQKALSVDAPNAIVKVQNCIGYAINTAGASVVFYGATGASLTCRNATAIGGAFCFQNDGITSFIAKNCYGGGSATSDYQGTITATTCASEDGSKGSTVAHSTSTFVNVTGGSQDYHIVTGSALKDAGTDLSADSPGFSIDIDGATRSGTWDIGADEFAGGGGAAAQVPYQPNYQMAPILAQ